MLLNILISKEPIERICVLTNRPALNFFSKFERGNFLLRIILGCKCVGSAIPSAGCWATSLLVLLHTRGLLINGISLLVVAVGTVENQETDGVTEARSPYTVNQTHAVHTTRPSYLWELI